MTKRKPQRERIPYRKTYFKKHTRTFLIETICFLPKKVGTETSPWRKTWITRDRVALETSLYSVQELRDVAVDYSLQKTLHRLPVRYATTRRGGTNKYGRGGEEMLHTNRRPARIRTADKSRSNGVDFCMAIVWWRRVLHKDLDDE
jgi:hypothetical protein